MMIPVPMSADSDEEIGFLMLSHELTGIADATEPSPARVRARVRHLDDDRMIDELTAREREILACVVNGFDARRIAAQLDISHATARNHVQRILNKLGVRNKAEAVTVALTYNLLAS
jgi:DNA-binding NarL/FixJ family response regulator